MSDVTLTIEGRQVQVPAGTSILEAAKTAGILVPHYCYHPALPIPALCRMCLVEVEKAPKLMPACQTTVADNQIVHVHSAKAQEARKGVLEMLLINHPLDCPICDQSGECELQDYTYAEGRADSRYKEPKRFNPVEDFGGDVMYVPNRCILCTRCVRFMEDVAKDPVLNVSERGDRALIGKFEGQDLTHPWAGNVVELCPVGALLSKDFLNKARAWELDRSASICPNCTQGCNATIETRDNVVVRLRPRVNDEVNQYFLCDQGRLDYRWLNRRDRATSPSVKGERAEWSTAVAAANDAMAGRKLLVLASPMLSNEALFLLGKLIKRLNGKGYFTVKQGPEAPLEGVKDLALRADRAANVKGAELFGFTRTNDLTSVLAGLGENDALLVADEELAGQTVASKAGATVVIGTTKPAWAGDNAVVLPTTNMAEEEGTFTNIRGRVQRYLQAKAAPGETRPTYAVLTDVLIAAGEPADYMLPSEVFAALAAAHPSFAGMSYDTLALKGAVIA
ncbi:MAG TPA: 2Fe-2S iron-sulfur cluster-binding protein [Gemmatimonadaceae bacterium]|nr:2Fe-2S iron-sulfur cluster-binding protein [Gemmatimonadaceae bacterium]